jgi:CRISPR-associated protein Cmr4
LAFGLASDEGQAASNAGALIPTDARLVCLPVRSFQGTFAWSTSALALRMFRRDLELAGVANPPDLAGPESDQVLVTRSVPSVLVDKGTIYLEDLDLPVDDTREADHWAEWIARRVFPDDLRWQAEFEKRFAVLPNDVFNFLTETGTEVTARVRIDDQTRTVAAQALWNEEALPAETILAGLIVCDRIPAQDAGDVTQDGLLAKFAKDSLTLQIGGKATVGRGRVRCIFTAVEGGAR